MTPIDADHGPDGEPAHETTTHEAPDHRQVTEMRFRTWEIELLISGAVVFTLLRVPGWLGRTYDRVDAQLSGNLFVFPYLAYYALTLVTYVLILAFVTHLVARAYWVGLIGLDTVFPRGVKWENVNYGPIVKDVYRRLLPDLPRLIRSTDRLSSSIFSVSFFFILMLVYSALMMLLVTPLGWLIHRFFFADERFVTVLFIVFLVFPLPLLVAQGLDNLAAKKWPRLARSERFRAIVTKIVKFYYYLSPTHFVGPIQFTLFTRLSKKILYPAMYVVIFGLAFAFLVSFMVRQGALRFHSYLYFHDDMRELGVDPKYYESQREPGEIFRRTPSIESEVVDGPYVKLFLPYSPRHHNEDLARACPDVEPVQEEGLALDRSRDLPDADRLAAALGCLASLWEVRLDGAPRDPEFLFHRHPETGVRGLVAYLPVDGLERGRHLLKIERRHHDEDLRETRRVHWIPFWT